MLAGEYQQPILDISQHIDFFLYIRLFSIMLVIIERRPMFVRLGHICAIFGRKFNNRYTVSTPKNLVDIHTDFGGKITTLPKLVRRQYVLFVLDSTRASELTPKHIRQSIEIFFECGATTMSIFIENLTFQQMCCLFLCSTCHQTLFSGVSVLLSKHQLCSTLVAFRMASACMFFQSTRPSEKKQEPEKGIHY